MQDHETHLLSASKRVPWNKGKLGGGGGGGGTFAAPGGGTGTAATGGGDGTGGSAISTVLASSSMPKTIVPVELANELRNRCQIEPNFIDALPLPGRGTTASDDGEVRLACFRTVQICL
jgi:hypothetical protein